MADITSANSTFTLALSQVFPVPQQLQGYATDDAFTVESVSISESFIGVDGKKSAGYTPAIVAITITFQADSPSIAIFDAWGAYMKTTRSCPSATGTIKLPAIGKAFSLNNCTLKNWKPLPDAKKVLQPVSYTIECESVDISLV